MSIDDYIVHIPWGLWRWPGGTWQPNPYITMPADEQMRQNIAHGYLCKHGVHPATCGICPHVPYDKVFE